MTQIPIVPDSHCLNEFERQNLESKISLLRRSLERFPVSDGEPMNEPTDLRGAENWAKSTTIHLFNLFKALVAIRYRTSPLKLAIQHTRQSFHAVFELVFCSIRGPQAKDFARARLSVETALNACQRLVA